MRGSRKQIASVWTPAIERSKWLTTAGIALGTLFMLLIPLLFLYEWRTRPAGERAATYTSSPPPAVAVSGNPACNGIKTPYHFGTEKPDKPFNSAGECSGDLWHKGHCIWATQAGSNIPQGPYCDKDGKKNIARNDLEYVWSADEPFDGYYRLSSPRYTKFIEVRN